MPTLTLLPLRDFEAVAQPLIAPGERLETTKVAAKRSDEGAFSAPCTY